MCVPRSKEAGPHALPDTVGTHVGTTARFAMTHALLRVGSGVFIRGSGSRTGPSPASDQGAGEQSPRHTLDCTLPTGCPHAPLDGAPPPLKPPGGGSRMALRGSGGSGGCGRREQGSSLEATAWTARGAGSHGPSLRVGATALSPGWEKGRRGRLRVCPPGVCFGSAAAPRGASWSALDEECPSRALTWGRGRQAWFPASVPVLPLALRISLGSFAAGLSLTH